MRSRQINTLRNKIYIYPGRINDALTYSIQPLKKRFGSGIKHDMFSIIMRIIHVGHVITNLPTKIS